MSTITKYLEELEPFGATLIAVSKTKPDEMIQKLYEEAGQKDFGENKIQEAVEKWTLVKKNFVDVNLHMIGKIQSNKVKFILPLFDYVHSLDNSKLAEKISEAQKKYKKKIKLFIQVNIGIEEQKSGISPNDIEVFKNKCVDELNLNIIGLMCLPPKNKEASVYFKEMNLLLKKINLKELSMGMSSDYLSAIEYNSTFVRVGTKIFGNRS